MPPAPKTEVILYTDGACSPNPGNGGWGVVMISPNHDNARRELSGAEPNSTNNRMELLAAIRGLQALKRPCQVKLYTDSQYLRNAFTKNWLKNWQRNGWKNAQKEPVKNKDLWLELLKLADTHEVSWHWVKAHANNEENNRCDELAVEARKTLDK